MLPSHLCENDVSGQIDRLDRHKQGSGIRRWQVATAYGKS